MEVLAGLVLAAALALQSGKAPYEPPDREPTPEETQILEFMNRLRANPSAEADLVAPPGRNDLKVDWKMFRDEMKALKAMPPLVFNLELLDSARKHSYYMVHNGLGHDETPGKTGFTGASPGDRMKASGYKGFGAAENAFAQSGGPWHSHWGFVVDYGEGPGGMQPGRGHRRNMMGAFREVGPGGVKNGDGLSVTHNFGSRDARMAGGVIYVDINGNNFYDAGEGVASIPISASDGTSVTTWKSGAYSLDLKGQKDVTLTAFLGGEKFSKTFPSGQENIKFDWVVPKGVTLKIADKFIDAAEKAKDAAKQFQTQISLYLNTRALYLDDARKKRVEELTKEAGAALESSQKAVTEALKDPEGPGLKKTLDEARKPYRGTDADAWFQDAETIGRLKRGVAGFSKSKPSDKEKKQFIAALEQEGARLKTTHFKQELSALVSKVRGL